MPTSPERALLASELHYRRLFEAARDGILILDAEGKAGKIIDANPFMGELLGYDRSDFLGKELWEIGLFVDRAENRDAFEVLREKGQIRYDHLPLRTKAGQEVEVEFVSNVYREGEAKVIQCNIRDITARRRLERQVQAQAETLADASRRKDEFLAILSHELRNPLGAILNAVQIFRLGKGADPIQANAMAMVGRQGTHLNRLVDDLLEATRITTGSVALRPERCEAGELIRNAIDGTLHLARDNNHNISVLIQPNPIWLNADPSRVEQMATNLIVNAIKYTDPGGRIEVELFQEVTEMVFRVRDSGIGISSDLLPHVLELFSQADRSLIRSQGGLGIGLNIVARLVRLHGGTVEAKSKGLGFGSEFVIRLPAEGESKSCQPIGPCQRKLRVLVVDDNADYADGVAMLLRSSGYLVEVAHTGVDALLAAAEFRPDVVVLDIGLPGMDGYEVARRIREDPDLEGVRVVGVSGYRQETESERSRMAHFDSYLLKPVLLERLEASFNL